MIFDNWSVPRLHYYAESSVLMNSDLSDMVSRLADPEPDLDFEVEIVIIDMPPQTELVADRIAVLGAVT